jgi:hypothetical protein
MCKGKTELSNEKLVSHGVAPSFLVHTLQHEVLSCVLRLKGRGNCV